MKKLIVVAVLLLLIQPLARAQSATYSSRFQGHGFFGVDPGIAPSAPSSTPVHVGFGEDVFPYKGLGLGLEAGYARFGRFSHSWIASGDMSWHFDRNAARGKIDPFALIGIAGLFPAGEGRGAPAGDFGAGMSVWLSQRVALRLAARDYAGANNDFYLGAHFFEVRIGFTFR